MKIRTLEIINYKGFKNSPTIHFGSGFNIVVGQNNAGKTALLEAFRFRGTDSRPYRGLSTNPSITGTSSSFLAEISLSGEELQEALIRTGGQFYIPIENSGDRNDYLTELFSKEKLAFKFSISHNNDYVSLNYPSHHNFRYVSNPVACVVNINNGKISRSHETGNNSDNLIQIFHDLIPRKIYVFRPERYNIGTCEVQDTETLDQNARNLPAVLFRLQGNTARFERFNSHLREIFPSIFRVVVVPQGNQASIRLWMANPASERDDLLIKLEECGTGIGQVLSILYVAMTRSGNILAIDEPSSFLHPGAARKLIEILGLYKSNQYIISTHAPELINISNPDKILQVRWTGEESTVEEFDKNSVMDLRRLLNDVGASLSDVFGADKIIWVEGPTEKECFPKILSAGDRRTAGVYFVPLRNTGDIENKTSGKAIIEIYNNLTAANHLLPPAISFNLDRETRSQKEIDEIVKLSDGKVKFLPRYAYENFLLNENALHDVLIKGAERYGFELAASVSDITKWLIENGEKYSPKDSWTGDIKDPNWISICNAPKILHALFQDITGNKLEYRKTTHSQKLTEWILEHSPDDFAELFKYLDELIKE